MDAIKEPVLEKRGSGKDIILLSARFLSDKKLDPSAKNRIESGGIVQLRFRGRKFGVGFRKAAGDEFVGRVFHFENSPKALEGLPLDGFINFHEENIFGYDPAEPRKSSKSSSKAKLD